MKAMDILNKSMNESCEAEVCRPKAETINEILFECVSISADILNDERTIFRLLTGDAPCSNENNQPESMIEAVIILRERLLAIKEATQVINDIL